jgi:hypothetical protein
MNSDDDNVMPVSRLLCSDALLPLMNRVVSGSHATARQVANRAVILSAQWFNWNGRLCRGATETLPRAKRKTIRLFVGNSPEALPTIGRFGHPSPLHTHDLLQRVKAVEITFATHDKAARAH